MRRVVVNSPPPELGILVESRTGRERYYKGGIGGTERTQTFIPESRAYEYLRDQSELEEVLVGSDMANPSSAVLSLDVPNGASTLRVQSTLNPRSADRIMRQLAHSCARIHRVDLLDDHPFPVLESSWVFMIHTMDPSEYTISSSAGHDFCALAGSEGLLILDALFDLTRQWHASTFFHNDLKWDNILVHPREGEAEPTQVKIIDWEMVGIGDPCWDIGTMLSEFVAFWALSIPVVDGEPYAGLAKYPIKEMQPAIRAFWESYAEAMEFNRATARERLIKSVRFAGARLIQTAYERTQTMTHLTPHIYLLLQLSLNIMEGPEDAAKGLFGIPLPDGVGA